MNFTWQIALTFCATSLLVVALVSLAYNLFFRYQVLVGQRLDELSGKKKSDANATLFQDHTLLHAQSALDRGNWRMRLGEALEQSGVRIKLPALLGISLGLGVALALAVGLLSQRWWATPVGLLPGLIAPWVYVYLKRSLRMRRLTWQLPEAFDVIGRAVRAGQTVPAAFQIVADDFGSPISDEFRRCYEQQNLGIPYDTALRDLARRGGIMELRILVVGLLVQSRSGGNLVELLNNLSTMARQRIKLQQKVQALTGEGRMQAAVLLVLPLLSFACLLVLAPDYMATLLRRPWLLWGAFIAQLAGAVWIRRIVNFEF